MARPGVCPCSPVQLVRAVRSLAASRGLSVSVRYTPLGFARASSILATFVSPSHASVFLGLMDSAAISRYPVRNALGGSAFFRCSSMVHISGW
mgnify:CR=1 FL=1